MIKALIFDFDGLILDTESPTYYSWQEIYQEYGCSLPLSKWAECIGSAETFDPHDYLEAQLGRSLDRVALRNKRRSRCTELIAIESIRPGVENYIFEAKTLDLKLGVASSSPRSWVDGHLSRLNLEVHFDAIKCADDVPCVKPDPGLFQATLKALEVAADEAIVLEDSLNGVLAAKRASIFCVAVPNPLMQGFSYDLADLRLSFLAELSLEELLGKAGET